MIKPSFFACYLETPQPTKKPKKTRIHSKLLTVHSYHQSVYLPKSQNYHIRNVKKERKMMVSNYYLMWSMLNIKIPNVIDVGIHKNKRIYYKIIGVISVVKFKEKFLFWWLAFLLFCNFFLFFWWVKNIQIMFRYITWWPKSNCFVYFS